MKQMYINQMIGFLSGSKKNINLNEIVDYYLQEKNEDLKSMDKRQLSRLLISKLNYEVRNDYKSSELLGFKVRIGDICYIDFGRAYISEAGFQHFGIIIGYCNSKALVVPMSSNYSMYQQSYCEKKYPNGKKHLYRLPSLCGLHKKSVLFLNDIKFINTARVIEVKGHINPKTSLFKDILLRVEYICKHNLDR